MTSQAVKREGVVVRDKSEKAEPPQPVLYADSDVVREIAGRLIPKYHKHLVNANIVYGCRDKAQRKSGVPSPGYAKKFSPEMKWLAASRADDEGAHFLIVVALEVWNNMAPNQRTALVDHLLTRCWGEEDPQNGSMRWKLRSPEVQEFSEIASRHGKWNVDLEHLANALT